MQEALVHLWLLEERRPGQRQSWYLQSCKFHLQNYITAGRSVDSPKRRSGKIAFNGDDYEGTQSDAASRDSTVLTLASARDIFASLSCRLTPFEQAILTHLADGWGAREIAEQLEISHPTVIKYRRRIAAMALRLGILPLPRYGRSSRSTLAAM